VQVEWSIQDAVGASGTEQDGCTAWRRCTMHVPTDTPLFVFLVAAVPHTGAVAYAQLRLALQMARNVAPAAPGAPPNLVVDALPQSVRLTELLQAFVPWPVVQALTHIPVIGHPLAHVATVQGGAPRLYRVRLGTGPPTLPGTPQQACTPACEDGELLDNLYLRAGGRQFVHGRASQTSSRVGHRSSNVASTVTTYVRPGVCAPLPSTSSTIEPVHETFCTKLAVTSVPVATPPGSMPIMAVAVADAMGTPPTTGAMSTVFQVRYDHANAGQIEQGWRPTVAMTGEAARMSQQQWSTLRSEPGMVMVWRHIHLSLGAKAQAGRRAHLVPMQTV